MSAIGEETRALPGHEGGAYVSRIMPSTSTARPSPATCAINWKTQLRASGELPLNMTLDTPRRYVETTGEGEIWLDERGLPARCAFT